MVAHHRDMASLVADHEAPHDAEAGPNPPGPTLPPVAASVQVQPVAATVPVATAVADRPPDLPAAARAVDDHHLDGYPHDHRWPDIPPGPFGLPLNPALIPLCLAPMLQALGSLGNGGGGGQPGGGGQGGAQPPGGGYFQPIPPPGLRGRALRDWWRRHPPICLAPQANGQQPQPGSGSGSGQPPFDLASLMPQLMRGLGGGFPGTGAEAFGGGHDYAQLDPTPGPHWPQTADHTERISKRVFGGDPNVMPPRSAEFPAGSSGQTRSTGATPGAYNVANGELVRRGAALQQPTINVALSKFGSDVGDLRKGTADLADDMREAGNRAGPGVQAQYYADGHARDLFENVRQKLHAGNDAAHLAGGQIQSEAAGFA